MKATIVVLIVTLVTLTWFTMSNAQSFINVGGTSGPLSGCPLPSARALVFCGVAGDPANPDGIYASNNGAAYFRIATPAAAVLPSTVVATPGQCLTGYDATTGKHTVAPCLTSLTKAQVLSTGVTATTTLQ